MNKMLIARTVLTMLIVAPATLAGTAAVAEPAFAPAAPASTAHPAIVSRAALLGYVKNRHSGKCLTVHGGSKANNAKVDQYTCVGAANQRWNFEWTGGSAYALRNVNSGKCLTVHGASKAKGAKVDQYTCVGTANQSFLLNISTPSNTPLRPRHSGKCIDVKGASTANNAAVIQWSCNGRSNQRWRTP
jgi:hypothetical protein